MAAGGGLLAACLALAVFALPGSTYETRPGERRQIALADGSQITLAPASRLRAASRWRPRALSLERGEAFFVVAHQDDQPFTVQAGDALVRVVGTRFNVHRGADRDVRVEVEQGVVQVSEGPNGQDRAVTLRAGQMAVADARGLTVGVLAQPELAGGWRQGRLAYDDAPLAEVVADLNRYSPRPLSDRLARHGPAEGHRRLRRRPGRPLRLRTAARAARAPDLGRSRRPGILVAADPRRAPEPHVR
jgi:transmembrane sensor